MAQRLLSSALLAWRPLLIKRYLAQHRVRKLHIGAGYVRLPGWLNTDRRAWNASYFLGKAVVLDAARPWPLDDAVLDYVHSEHVIEHLPLSDGAFMLGEAFRTLKPGGRIRIATPDLERIARLVTDDPTEAHRRYVEGSLRRFSPDAAVNTAAVVVNNFMHAWGHRFIYDRKTLESLLSSAGFHALAEYGPGESDDRELRGIERHGQAIGEEAMMFETMVVEGSKPPSGGAA
jgi:predicted SAM-dependent methyltransferase